ncbi:MAG: histidine phosphatase family protein [Thermodesulfobacteriota bacterium]|nr:histidine phosphatase family protein [Thermodesulfobacteriota bacterium]
MTRVILVRHGETDWNKEQVFRGRIDLPLNSSGLQQARKTGEVLSRQRIEAIYSSPLSRAIQTANGIAQFHSHINIKEAKGFIDIDFGKWQGMPHKDVQNEFKDLYGIWQRKPQNLKMPSGEGLDDVKLRAMESLNNILRSHVSETVVIISHRVVNKVVLCAILGLSNQYFWRIRQDTCAINIFEDSDMGFIVFVINDTCHINTFDNGIDKADF